MSVPPDSCSSSIATTVFGSCISARIPSCMRAPPEAETETSVVPSSAARSQARDELLADDAPHRAAHEREVHDREPAAAALDRGAARDHRVAEARRELGLGEPLRVRPQVEEVERVRRAEVGVLLVERARVGKLLDPLARPHREVVAALLADAEVLGELVVAVVRAAAGTGVRMGLVRRGSGVALALDGDVDAIGPGGHGLILCASRYRPAAASRRAITGTFRLVGQVPA